jgi:hypothetical protein
MARGDGHSVIKRKRNGRELRNYEVRIQVPAAWQATVGKKEVLLSLGTGDRQAANLAAPQVVAEKYAEWRRLAGDQPSAPQLDPTAVAVGVGFDSMFTAMEDRRKAWPTDDVEYARRLADRKANLLRWTRKLQDGDLSQWEAVADRLIAKGSLPFEKGSDEHAGFVQAVAESTIDAIGVFKTDRAGAPATTAHHSVQMPELRFRSCRRRGSRERQSIEPSSRSNEGHHQRLEVLHREEPMHPGSANRRRFWNTAALH